MAKRKEKKRNTKFSFIGRSCQGFTLVEIMVVLAMMAIMAVIAIPNFISWVPNYKLKSAARDLYSAMQQARIGAVKTNKDWAIVFDVANNQYFICSDSGGDSDWSTVVDNTVELQVSLSGYGSGVQYGYGNATKEATTAGTPFPVVPDNDLQNTSYVSYASDVAIFNSQGTGSSGYVYLDHSTKTIIYTVGSLSSGVVKLKKWVGTQWE